MILYPILFFITIIVVIVNKFIGLSKPGMQLTIFSQLGLCCQCSVKATFKDFSIRKGIALLPFAAQSLPWLVPVVIELSFVLPINKLCRKE